jgi:hypothetical protein
MHVDGEQLFWVLAGVASLVGVGLVGFQIVRYGFLVGQDLWRAWQKRR